MNWLCKTGICYFLVHFFFSNSIAQSGWGDWKKIYDDGTMQVELNIYQPSNGCVPNSKPFKFKGRITGNWRNRPTYLTFKLDYLGCDGNIFFLQESFNIYNPGGGYASQMLIESLDFTFVGEKIADPFYDVKISETKLASTGLKPKDINDNLILIKGGTFKMGCTEEQGSDCDSDEKKIHEVEVRDFYIGKYEVTQRLWFEIMQNNPSGFNGCDDCPVEQVSWDDIQVFLNRLNVQTGRQYRLPSEAEWEYAARGGQNSKRFRFAGSNYLEEVGWYKINSGWKTRSVGTKAANELGIYDMSGNVWEWCNDRKGPYDLGFQLNPKGPSSGFERIIRGGSWFNEMRGARCSYRNFNYQNFYSNSIGFRLAMDH